MTNKKYPRLFRGGDPERRHDDVTGGLSDESESEQTSIRPHKVSEIDTLENVQFDTDAGLEGAGETGT